MLQSEKRKKKLRKTADNLLLIVFNHLYPKSMKNSSKVFLKNHRSRLLALVEIFPFDFYWRKTVLYVFGWLAVVQLFKSLLRIVKWSKASEGTPFVITLVGLFFDSPCSTLSQHPHPQGTQPLLSVLRHSSCPRASSLSCSCPVQVFPPMAGLHGMPVSVKR